MSADANLYYGRPIDPEHLPTKIKLEEARWILPDVLFGFGGLVVTERVEDLIEALEPDRHRSSDARRPNGIGTGRREG